MTVQFTKPIADSPDDPEYDPEWLWREACWEYLRACFTGALPSVIRIFADAVELARR